MNGRWVGKALLAMVGLGLALGTTGCQHEDRNPFIFEIPAGYKGWVSVRFFEGSCPELPVEGEKMLVKLPATGRLCTISPLGFGKVADEYYYVDASGNRTDASGDILQEHAAIEGASPNKQIYERFFVGTAEELKNSPEPRLE